MQKWICLQKYIECHLGILEKLLRLVQSLVENIYYYLIGCLLTLLLIHLLLSLQLSYRTVEPLADAVEFIP